MCQKGEGPSKGAFGQPNGIDQPRQVPGRYLIGAPEQAQVSVLPVAVGVRMTVTAWPMAVWLLVLCVLGAMGASYTLGLRRSLALAANSPRAARSGRALHSLPEHHGILLSLWCGVPALAALGPDLAGPGACNEQFMREDALLVLVIITDEEEEGSAGDPPEWFNAITALKGGVETNIVVLSLIGPKNPACKDAAEIGERLTEFTEMFTYGSVGQICAPSYKQFFSAAISVIDTACENFMPPG